VNDEASANPKEPLADSGTEAIAALEARAAAQAQELEAMRRSLAGAVADSQGLQRTLRTRQRELDQLRGTLVVAIRTLREQLERVVGGPPRRERHPTARAQ
jgi:hypothetical protein